MHANSMRKEAGGVTTWGMAMANGGSVNSVMKENERNEVERIHTISFIRDSVKICLDVSQKNFQICIDCLLTLH